MLSLIVEILLLYFGLKWLWGKITGNSNQSLQKHQQQMEEMQKKHQQQMQEMQDEHQQQMEEMQKKHQQQMQALMYQQPAKLPGVQGGYNGGLGLYPQQPNLMYQQPEMGYNGGPGLYPQQTNLMRQPPNDNDDDMSRNSYESENENKVNVPPMSVSFAPNPNAGKGAGVDHPSHTSTTVPLAGIGKFGSGGPQTMVPQTAFISQGKDNDPSTTSNFPSMTMRTGPSQ